jgi:hypothetical protein
MLSRSVNKHGRHSQLIATRWAIFIEVLPRMLPTKFRLIRQRGFRGEDFLEINQSEAKIACGGHVYLWSQPDPLTNMADTVNSFFSLADLIKSSTLKPLCQMNRNLVGSIWQVLYKDWSLSQRRRFVRNQPITIKNGLWWPCLLTDRN